MSTLLPADFSTPVRVAAHTRFISRGRVLQWLRATHLWLGLWGALLGFVFGLTGFLLNHRAVMKIPVERAAVTTAQIVVTRPFAQPESLASWLRERATLPDARVNIRKEPAATVQWRGNALEQPERWTINLSTPKATVIARHLVGSGVVEVETQDATLWGVLIRMHMGTGATGFWILLTDTIAGAFMILTLSGVLLWTKLRAPRLLGAAVCLGAPMIAIAYVAMT